MSGGPRHAALDCADLLEQGRSILEGLPEDLYAPSVAPEVAPGPSLWSSTGAHTRHVTDFVDCLLVGLDARRIDYTARKRNLEVEHSREAGLREIQRCIDALVSSCARLGETLAFDVRTDTGESWTESTLGRELRFVAGHTIHHYALIRMTLAQCGVALPEPFGVAASTLASQRAAR